MSLIDSAKDLFKRNKNQLKFIIKGGGRAFLLDTSFIVGDVKHFSKTGLVNNNFLDLKKINFHLFITYLGFYETVKSLVFDYNLKKSNAKKVCEEFFPKHEITVIATPPINNLDRYLENWLEIDVPDGIHIESAKALKEIPILTEETKAEKLEQWKKLYPNNVMTKEIFWNQVKSLLLSLKKV